jgi:hypothetical protein
MTDEEELKKDVIIEYSCKNNKLYFTLCLADGYTNSTNYKSGIQFYTFNDLVSPTSQSYDVLTFYITFILIIGKFIRSIISGEAERVIYTEMPNPNKLLNLCEGIKISRYKKDLIREDKLYYVLVDLLRSPEMLKAITKSSLKFTQSVDNIEDKNKEGGDSIHNTNTNMVAPCSNSSSTHIAKKNFSRRSKRVLY